MMNEPQSTPEVAAIYGTPEQIAAAQQFLAEHRAETPFDVTVEQLASIPSQHAARVAEVATETRTGVTLDSISALIAQARGTLGVPDQADPSKIEAANPESVNALIAAQDDLKAQIDALTKERSQIQAIFRDILAEHDVLTVNGAEVVTYKTAEDKRELDAAQVAKVFPDIPENAELWLTKPGARTLRFKA